MEKLKQLEETAPILPREIISSTCRMLQGFFPNQIFTI